MVADVACWRGGAAGVGSAVSGLHRGAKQGTVLPHGSDSCRAKRPSSRRRLLRRGSDQRSLLALATSPTRGQALSAIAQLSVLEDFAVRAIDVVTGDTEPAAVIWLKTYFLQEGRAEGLRQAVAGVQPKLLPDFDQVGAIDDHTPADVAWLSALTKALADATDRLSATLFDAYAKDVRETAERFAAFGESVSGVETNVRFVTLGALVGKPSGRAANLQSELDARYPMPEAMMHALVAHGPVALAGDDVRRFCPGK